MAGSRSLGNGPCTPADEPVNVPAALGTILNGGIGHLLALLEPAGTFIAEIFVGRHGRRSPVFFHSRRDPATLPERHSVLPINSQKGAQSKHHATDLLAFS